MILRLEARGWGLGMAILMASAAPARGDEIAGAFQAIGEEALQTLAWQIALESWGFSPGLLDGKLGRKTRLALCAAQTAFGLPASGNFDSETARILGVDPEGALARHPVADSDLRDVDDCPNDWYERSRRKRLAYRSLPDLLAERFHTSQAFLSELNPRRPLRDLAAGDRLIVPASRAFKQRREVRLSRVEIDLERKLILLLRQPRPEEQYLVGMLHCSIAANPEKAPPGTCQVVRVVVNPSYTFDPAKWPEVKNVKEKLLIPPGPRCPVGVRWIQLDRDGVGLHGSPEPENIGKTGSHGCFRLTNWDAVWLSLWLREGTPVHILKDAAATSWPNGVPAL
ncbi:MAG: murein L,D-transpeptidase [Planctomycetes bacterium]|nr:murein L,D-transpeptidase [Planctomycetota bacterium]